MEMNRIFDDKVLHVLSNDARIRILNCIRVIESLKRDLDNSGEFKDNSVPFYAHVSHQSKNLRRSQIYTTASM